MKNKEIIFSLLKLKNILNQVGRKNIFSEQGLTVSNFEILKLIFENQIKIVSDLQEYLTDSLASLTQKTQKLESLGYLKKEKDNIDPRKNILTITKKGERALERVEKKIDLVSAMIFKKFSPKEKKKFLEMIIFLENKLENKLKKKTKK